MVVLEGFCPYLCQELFRLVDNDGDGSLSPEEFVQAMELPSVQQYLKFLEPWLDFCIIFIRSD